MPRVVIVDDSPYARSVLGSRLTRRGFDVVTCSRGEEALKVVPRVEPDLVTMDVIMPGMDGLVTVRALRQIWHGPIFMVSGHSDSAGDLMWKALEAGATEFVPKPGPGFPLEDVVATIVKKFSDLMSKTLTGQVQPESRTEERREGSDLQAIVIGASTGGPKALLELFSFLCGVPTVSLIVIQHMPQGFTTSFAGRLAHVAKTAVKESPEPGQSLFFKDHPAVLATGGLHLRLSRERFWSETGERVHGVIPAVDVTLKDAARAFGAQMAAVILTGMGEDGKEGALAVQRAGGLVIAESQETAVVYGMPKAVIEAKAAHHIWPLGRIGQWLSRVTRP